MDKRDFMCLDTNARETTPDFSRLFPNWGTDERLMVMSPHDDDAIIGAGYMMQAAALNGAEVFITIFCQGDAGYSTLREKATIEAVRERETLLCYARLGVAEDHIFRMGFRDFSAIGNWGWETAAGREGEMPKLLKLLRKHKITRLLVPNHYHEHIDHLAAHLMASYDAPQAGDVVIVDYGDPHPVRSVLEYSVWADLSPEDALVQGRDPALRANRVLLAPAEAEEKVGDCVRAYASQGEIIGDLLAARAGRKTADGRYMEPYILFDPRPRIDFKPYLALLNEMNGGE